MIEDGEVSIWIGLDNENRFDFMIPNVYEFKHNLTAVDSNVVGFPARCEPRKNLHFLQNTESIALTSEPTFNSIFKDYKKKVNFTNIEIDDYRVDKIENFYKRTDWGISHSCYENEPFGYSIFQSIDFGKIPILHKNWCKDMEYPFRATTQKQFEKQVAKISKLSVEDKNTYLSNLRSYLSKYTSVEKWRDELLSIYNQDGDQIWLPTDISPSKSV